MIINVTHELTYRRNEDGSHQHGPAREQRMYVGVTLACSPWHYHVPSDNAMIDDGTGWELVVWTGHSVRTVRIATGRDGGGCYTTPTVDASPEIQILAARWKMVQYWFNALRTEKTNYDNRLKHAAKIKPGDRVQVFKGRKVPKGVYYVVKMGESRYGPYVNLSTQPGGFGDYFTFVSKDNVRKLPEDVTTSPEGVVPAPGHIAPYIDAEAYQTARSAALGDKAAFHALFDKAYDAGAPAAVLEELGWFVKAALENPY